MAKITWSASEAFNLDSFTLGYGLTTSGRGTATKTSDQYVVKYTSNGKDRDVYRGYDFTYGSDGLPSSGTLTSVVGYDNNKKIGSFTGINIDIAILKEVEATASRDDNRQLFSEMLAGDDVIVGSKKNDKIEGFAGNDKLMGGNGSDKLYGNEGADKLYGGKGADAFVFTSIADSTAAAEGRDTIYDFSSKQKDKINLRAVDANTLIDGDQAFNLIGKKAFSKKAGELRYEKAKGGVYVHGDVDGDGNADFSIFMKGISKLAKGDFYL